MIHISVDDMNSFQHLVSLLGLMKGGQMGEVNGSFSFLTSTTFEKSESESQEDVGLAS